MFVGLRNGTNAQTASNNLISASDAFRTRKLYIALAILGQVNRLQKSSCEDSNYQSIWRDGLVPWGFTSIILGGIGQSRRFDRFTDYNF